MAYERGLPYAQNDPALLNNLAWVHLMPGGDVATAYMHIRKAITLAPEDPDLHDTLEFISIYDILGLQRKEASAMGALQFADLQARPTEVLDLTSLTVEEFRQLVPPFETAFQAHMAHWRLDGQPRTARRYTIDKNCPLPTPEDRLLCILVYLKTSPLQVVQGRLFGYGPEQGASVDSCPVRRPAGEAVRAGGGAHPVRD
jgi:hypothetical protein